MVTTKSDLLILLHTHESEIRAFGVQRLALFGSFGRDQVNEDSDLDLVVEFELEKKNYENFSGLAIFLEDLTGRKVELVTEESLSPYIGPKILREMENVAIDS